MANVKVVLPQELEDATTLVFRVELSPDEAEALGTDPAHIQARIVQVRNYVASTFAVGGNGGANIPRPIREQLESQARARAKPRHLKKALAGAKDNRRRK
jgi:hypothetical protein